MMANFISFFIIGCLFYSANGLLDAQVNAPEISVPSCSCPAGHEITTIERNSAGVLYPSKFETTFYQNDAPITETNTDSIIESAFVCATGETCSTPNFAKMRVDLSKPAFNDPEDERINVESITNYPYIVRALQFRVKFAETFTAKLTDANGNVAETCTASDLPDSTSWKRVTCDFCTLGSQPDIMNLELSFQQNTVVENPKKFIKVTDLQIFACTPIV